MHMICDRPICAGALGHRCLPQFDDKNEAWQDMKPGDAEDTFLLQQGHFAKPSPQPPAWRADAAPVWRQSTSVHMYPERSARSVLFVIHVPPCQVAYTEQSTLGDEDFAHMPNRLVPAAATTWIRQAKFCIDQVCQSHLYWHTTCKRPGPNESVPENVLCILFLVRAGTQAPSPFSAGLSPI